MLVYFLFFHTKILPNGAAQVLFALTEANTFLQISNFNSFSLEKFVHKNHLIRHEKFDFLLNRDTRKVFLFEIPSQTEKPFHLFMNSAAVKILWYSFPRAAALLANSNLKVILQLAVQYVAAGGVDESVIAADYDEAFIRDLLSKI